MAPVSLTRFLQSEVKIIHIIVQDQDGQSNNDEMVKRIMEGKPEGRRGVGRPCSRWRDAVQEDLKKLKIQNWWTETVTEKSGGEF